MAVVIGIKGDSYQLRFTLSPESVEESRSNTLLGRLNGDVFYQRTADVVLAGAVVGSRYQVVASVITQGTCTPVIYEIGLAEKWVADAQACSQLTATESGANHFQSYQEALKLLNCASMTKDVADMDTMNIHNLLFDARIYSLQQLGGRETKTDPPRKYSELTSAARLARLKQLADSNYLSEAQ
jgi:hypothetical protein